MGERCVKIIEIGCNVADHLMERMLQSNMFKPLSDFLGTMWRAGQHVGHAKHLDCAHRPKKFAEFRSAVASKTLRTCVALVGLFLGVSVNAQALPSSGIELQDIRAQVKSIQQATLAAEVGGRIKQLPIDTGQRFSQGDVLIELDCSVPQAQKAKAQAELDGAIHTLRANEKMYALESMGELEVLMAKSQRDRASAELAVIKAQIDKCQIRAPFSGVLSEQLFEPHEYVQTGQPIVEVFDDSLFEVEFLTPSVWVSWLKPGLTFDLRIDELDTLLTAVISRVGTRIDPVSQSIEVTGEILEPPTTLKPGMSGQALLEMP